jgi:hypothetical protein
MKPPNTSSVLEAAVKLKTSERAILEMIADGKFKPDAINTSKGKQRPRWSIPNEAIEAIGRPVTTLPPQLKNITQHV